MDYRKATFLIICHYNMSPVHDISVNNNIIIHIDNKKEAIISLGKVHGVKMGDLFDVFGVTLKFKDPFSQTDLGDKYDRHGVLRIKDVQEKFSVGEIVAGQEIWEGDLARSRKFNRLPIEEATSARVNQ